MRGRDRQRAQELEKLLISFRSDGQPLPGITADARRTAFLEQLVESIHRVEYPRVISRRDIAPARSTPTSELFDPLKAALLQKRAGNMDEAFWLVFLSVHFGRHRRSGWELVRAVYGRLGDGQRWDWLHTSATVQAFRQWLAQNQQLLVGRGTGRGFGNHRKYQSIDAWKDAGTGAAVESYVNWIGSPQTHEMLLERARAAVGNNARLMFHYLYRSMGVVVSFGRTARFDYLTMLGKLGIAPIEPDSTYMEGATGPFAGARLLFFDDPKAAADRHDVDRLLIGLDAELRVGMQVLEDALCNWQKSPDLFKPFRG